ncbi:MAG: S1 RNA-binding domain-containing protein [Phycisphaerales bacterium]|nr:S1 RNA-binding domain-containing protein [Phycisphaerales bacterium]
MDNQPQTPDQAPAHEPQGAPAPTPVATTQDTASAPVELSADLAAAANAAMEQATLGTDADPKQDAPHHEIPAELQQGSKAPGGIRGPRVVQGGREYREGTVVSVGPDDIFIEFGPKSLGVLPRIQFKDQASGEEKDLPTVGGKFEVVVDRYEPSESLYICSRPGVVQKADWEMLQIGQTVEARVTGTNKGGLELEVAQHRAFMPASLVSDRRIADMSVFVGEKMACKVAKVDRSGKGNIVLDRRAILDEEKKQRAGELKDKLNVGDTVEGTVKSVVQFGAFVDIGGIDGLLHISDISHDRVRKVEDHIKEGQTVQVQILKLDWDKGRHSLGMKQLQADPFQTGVGEMKEGDVVQGRITKLAEFGAFIEIAPGIEGLAHISELEWRRVEKTSDVVQPNQVLPVKILKIDPDKKKISLSVKQAKERPEPRGGGAPRGRGKGRGERDDRTPEEILKETPALRRMREKAQQKGNKKAGKGQGGLGEGGGLGLSLGDLKL